MERGSTKSYSTSYPARAISQRSRPGMERTCTEGNQGSSENTFVCYACNGRDRDATHQLQLHIQGERPGQAVGVDEVRGQALGLQPDDVPVLVREPLHLLEDGRAVPRPHAGPVGAVVVRQEVLVVDDDLVRRLVGVSFRALDQRVLHFHATFNVEVGERRRREVGRLLLQLVPVDGAGPQARRGAGFQPRQGESEAFQRERQPDAGEKREAGLSRKTTATMAATSSRVLTWGARPRPSRGGGGRRGTTSAPSSTCRAKTCRS